MQLAQSGLMSDVFSLCYGFPQGGSMLLGELAWLRGGGGSMAAWAGPPGHETDETTGSVGMLLFKSGLAYSRARLCRQQLRRHRL